VVVTNGKLADCLPLLDAEKGSDMARPTQSEPSLSLDRRQWLASAAALGVGNIPGPDAAVEVTNSGPAVTVAEIPTSDVPALKVCAGTAQKIQEIASRNIIRAEAGLPLLSIPKELRRMKQVTDAMAFEEFSAQHRQTVWDDVLAPVREAKAEPNWYPTRFLDGLAYQSRVSKILHERFEGLSRHREELKAY
jgi:hypothetical protein